MAKKKKNTVRRGLLAFEDMEQHTSKATGTPGALPHNHTYKKGDKHTSMDHGHRHRISRMDGETELSENHVHEVFSNSFDF